MEPATEGMSWLRIIGIAVAVIGIGAGSAWFGLWFRQRALERRGPGDPKDDPKLPR